MKRISFVAILLAAINLQVWAQNEIDALRFSSVSPGGTARFMSTGGAFGALGGDFSSLGTNPAGIGVYRTSEFTITPNLNFTSVGSTFLGNTQEDVKYNFALSNIGFVFAFNNTNSGEGWRGFNFGFGLNQQANFNNRRVYEGLNTQNSLRSVFLDIVNDLEQRYGPIDPADLDAYTTGLAYDTYLMDEDEFGYWVDEVDILQRRVTNTSGSIREFNFTFGANYSDRLYLGASVGVPFLRFEEDYTLYENNAENSGEFVSMEFTERLKTTGVGANFKFGAIFRANDMVRLGASVHTPTFYNLEDEWDTSMKSNIVGFAPTESKSPNTLYDYQLHTPLKAIGSLALVFGTAGLVSMDYEFADYTQMRYRSNEHSYDNINTRMQRDLQAQHNLRFGGELRLNPIVLRGGYALSSNPYKTAEVSPIEKSTISAGIGIRDKSFYIDFGYAITQYSEDFFQYYTFNLQRQDAIRYNFDNQRFLMTLGFRF